MRVEALALEAGRYEPHPLHRSERVWTETNCYVDLWIEVLHALGLDPVAAGAFTLSTDFEGDQWTMFKYPVADLRDLFGLEIVELNVWRPLVEHVAEQLSFGRLLSIDVDAWFLPDTRGVTYRTGHQKTTLAAQMVDVEDRQLGYFHNAGYHELAGDDFDGLLGLGEHRTPEDVLAPYVEVVRLDRLRVDDPDRVDRVRGLAKEHLARRPVTNPVARFVERLRVVDLGWLAGQDIETFHRYAFGTCRQCGSSAELAAEFVGWLARAEGVEDVAGSHLRALSDGAKTLQFALARAVRGRTVDLDEICDPMVRAWDAAMSGLVDRYGG